MFERESYFFHYCLLSCRYVMFPKRILSRPTPKWEGAQAVVRGGGDPLAPRSNGTVNMHYNNNV